ncbi:MAG: TonB-dependent receptor [Gemmatimonadetes bacterium]|nr:TonB-dependent receptor [Gemmatimonadota bacterium]
MSGSGAVRGALTALGVVSLLLAPAAGEAQQSPGRILGRVVSEGNGEPVSGAHVGIQGMDGGALSNREGRYVIQRVEPGVHDLVVQVIGFARKTVTGVVVPEGGTVHLDVSLATEAVRVGGITVSAAIERGSTTALLNERRSSGVVVDAIGSEQIARTPDGDAAAVLARSPGVSVVDSRYMYVRGLGDRYGAASLNGSPLPSPEQDRKVVPLDIIPSSFLESVVTAKTYSPDQPGDYAGGLVQIRTRNFPARRIVELGLGTSYDTQASFATGLGGGGGGAYDFLAFDDGGRSLPPLPAQRLTATNYAPGELEVFGEQFIGHWGPRRAQLPVAQSFSVAVGNEASWFDGEVPVGYLIALNQSTDYTNREMVERVLTTSGIDDPAVDYTGTVTTRSARLGGMLNFSVEPTPSNRLTLAAMYNRTADDEGRILQGYNLDFSTNQRNTRIRYLVQDLVSAQLKGEHELGSLGDTRVSWRTAFSRTARYEPNTREVLYRQVPDGRYLFDTFVQSGSVFHSDLDEAGLGGALDVEVPLRLRDLPASLSFGAAADLKERSAYARRFRFLPVGSLTEDIRARDPNQLFTRETIHPLGFQIQEATFPGDNYGADQQIRAVYAMADAEILPRLRLVGGARVEQARQTVSPIDRFLTTAAELESADLNDTDVLPGINLTYSPTEAVNLRLGLSRTVARPQFRELAPFQFTDYAGGYLTIGNPALQRTRIQNYDVRWEWFPGLGSLVAVSGFFKRFEQPIETIVLSSTELMRTWVNAEAALNYGAELEVRAPLGGLGRVLEPVSFNANLTWIESEVNTGGTVRVFLPFGAGLTDLSYTDRSRPLQGQSPYVANLGLSYAAAGTNVTLLYNRFGRRIDTVGGSSLPDIYEEDRGQLDLVLQQVFGRGFSASLRAKRLLGSDMEFTQDGEIVRSYDLGRVVSLSVSWDLGG